MSAVSSFASIFRGGMVPKAARAYIVPLDGYKKDAKVTSDQRSFQYYPATLTDSRQTPYQQKEIPGLSHPLYQWTTGGAREISFVAIFSRDRALTKSERNEVDIYGYIKPKGSAEDQSTRNIYIPSAIAWLRSFTYPEYTVDGQQKIPFKRARPPRKLILGLPGLQLNPGNTAGLRDEVTCIMTNCEVSYEGFFSDGTPRLARVQLGFAEIIQVGGTIAPHDAFNVRYVGHVGYRYNVSGK